MSTPEECLQQRGLVSTLYLTNRKIVYTKWDKCLNISKNGVANGMIV